MSGRIEIEPLTADRWKDLVTLFGPGGACWGCWCMWPHQTGAEFERNKGRGNRDAFRRRVRAGVVPGVLAYRGDDAVGWCAIEPRSDYERLARSRVLAPVDELPVWSLVCLFVHRDHRRTGVSRALVRGAVSLARSRGARCVEAYPVDPGRKEIPDIWAHPGLASTFRKLGFREVARRSPTRPILRRNVRPAR